MKIFLMSVVGIIAERSRLLFATLLIMILICFSMVLYSQSFDKAKMDQLFSKLDEKHKAMGAILITKSGNIIYDRKFGFSIVNAQERKPIESSTRFRIGSVSKMFTAIMVLQLVEEGKIQLSTKLDKFFPEITNASKITIAHVLSHRSGIHDIFNDSSFRETRDKPQTEKELLAFLSKAPADFEPGSKYAYSNPGFVVLGYLVEKVTSKSYQSNLQARITEKIGLPDTYSGEGVGDPSKREAFSYRYTGDWEQVESRNVAVARGAGGLISTAGDLTKFIQALFSAKLIKATTLQQMIQNKFGMDEFVFNDKTFYGHSGGFDNFGTMLLYLPDESLTVTYMTNAKVFPVAQIMEGAFNIYYNKTYQVPDFDGVAVSPTLLDKYVGVYSSAQAPVKFTVTREGDKLFIQAGNESPAPLVAIADDKFKIESAPVEFRFDSAQNQMFIIRANGERVFNKEK